MNLPVGTTQKALFALAAAPLVFVVMIALGHWLKRRAGVRLGIAYRLFCVVIALYVPMKIFGVDFDQRDLGAAAVLLGSFIVMALVRRYLWEYYFQRTRHTEIPPFVRDLAALVIFVLTLAFVLAYFYNRPLTGLIAGSGIVAIVLGFAMQDLLGNIISGIVLHVGKPFQPGDWLMFESHHAEVIEVNWRSTRLRTNDDICLDIPNSMIVKNTVTNLSYPTKVHAMRISVGVDYKVPPNRVKELMTRAALGSIGVLAEPRPRVFLKEFGDSAVIYELKFSMDRDDLYNEIFDSIRTNFWYEFHRNGVSIPYPIRTLHVAPRGSATKRQAVPHAALDCLRDQPLFQFLDAAQLEKLLAGARMQLFGCMEKLIEQGALGDSMFILVDGVADVFVGQGEERTRVATLHEGEFFGEMSLLTGERRSATVVAQTDCEALEIPKDVLAGLLQENPDLLQRLSESLAQRRLETEGILATTMERNAMMAKQMEYRDSFVKKISSFFAL